MTQTLELTLARHLLNQGSSVCLRVSTYGLLSSWLVVIAVSLAPSMAVAGRYRGGQSLKTKQSGPTRSKTKLRDNGLKSRQGLQVKTRLRSLRRASTKFAPRVKHPNSNAALKSKVASNKRTTKTRRRVSKRSKKTANRKKASAHDRKTRKASKSAGRRSKLRASLTETVVNSATLGLLLTGARSMHRVLNLNRAFGTFIGIAAPIALALGSTYSLVRARNLEERSDASHGLLWAAQAGAQLAGRSFGNLAVGLGLTGGALQVSVGAYRVKDGWKSKNWSRVTSGSLDIAAGGAWALTAVNIGLPVSMGVFIGATLLKMVHENRAPLAKAAKKLRGTLSGWLGRRSELPRPIVTSL